MDSVEDIKSRLDVVDLVGEYLTLKPAGTNAFKANCPFHNERSPSFYVSRARQSWHCFGCNIGGDIFSFIERIEGMEFREALEHLAQKTGVELPKFDTQKATQKKQLQEVNELAMRFFRSVLHSLPQAEIARAYLKKRGVDDLTADLFHLGYAPDSWTLLSEALQKKGVTAQDLIDAGLSSKSQRGDGVYDRFRGRLMFPIADVHGHIVGFTGRILTDDKTQAKYVNTPETPVYRKSAVLYGLDRAKGAIRQQDLAVIVEGNMDVVASHQFAVENVVASSGTALTVEQLALLKRFTKKLAIAFDADAAGNTATLRGLDLARQQDFEIRVITLPPGAGKDPDEAVRKDPQIWKDAIKEAVSIMEWIYANAFRGQNAHSPEGKKAIVKAALPEIKRIQDPVERDHWVKRLATDLGVGEEAIREAMGKTSLAVDPAKAKAAIVQELPSAEGLDLERRWMAGGLKLGAFRKELREPLGMSAECLADGELQTLYRRLASLYDQADPTSGTTTPDLLRPPAGLTPDETKTFDALAFLAEREFQDLTRDQLARELKTGATTLLGLHKARERKRLEQEMRDAERIGDAQKIADLVERFRQLLS
jgi:DNA primase